MSSALMTHVSTTLLDLSQTYDALHAGRAASGVITKYGAMAMPSPAAGLELDVSEDYSFANLTVSRTSAGTVVDKQQPADGSGASTFEVCYFSALPWPSLVTVSFCSLSATSAAALLSSQSEPSQLRWVLV